MSEAEIEADGADAAEEQDEETEAEPTFRERVREVDVDEAGAKEPEDRTDEEKEAVKLAELEEEHSVGVDDLSAETVEAKEELERLYYDEGLSLMDIARLADSTDATVQRWMENHGLERRGNRAELDEDELVDALLDLAVEHNSADDVEELAGMVEDGEAVAPTTTLMTDQGAHSAHTYYRHWDGWAEVQERFYEEVGAEPPEDDGDDEADSEESAEDDGDDE